MCDCVISAEKLSDFVCIIDFCGSFKPGFPTSFWADYNPEDGITHYGGDWSHIPDFKTDHEPTHDEAWEHAVAHMINPEVLL